MLYQTSFASVLLYLEQSSLQGNEKYTVLGGGQHWQVSISEEQLHQPQPVQEDISVSQAAWGKRGGKLMQGGNIKG